MFKKVWSFLFRKKEICPKCYGDGLLICGNCGGTGCEKCFNGKKRCEKCKGKGQI